MNLLIILLFIFYVSQCSANSCDFDSYANLIDSHCITHVRTTHVDKLQTYVHVCSCSVLVVFIYIVL